MSSLYYRNKAGKESFLMVNDPDPASGSPHINLCGLIFLQDL